MRNALLPALLVLSVLACGQTTIQIADSSPQGAPITLRGTVTFSATDTVLTATGHNSSSKQIIAFVVDGIVSDTKGEVTPVRKRHDHYFQPNGFAPSSDFDIFSGSKLIVRQDTGVAPSANLQVVYVQFADGSTWGDSNIGQLVMNDRQASSALLKQMLVAYEQSESSGDSLLNQEPKLPDFLSTSGMVYSLRLQRKDAGSAAVMEGIRNRLAQAASRGF